jgi:hypothetical protein
MTLKQDDVGLMYVSVYHAVRTGVSARVEGGVRLPALKLAELVRTAGRTQEINDPTIGTQEEH